MTQDMMTPEVEQLRSTVRALIRDHRTVERPDDPRIDASLWKKLAVEVGVAALAIPDEFGGSGSGLLELSVVMEEIGSELAVVPLLASTGIAAAALAALGDTVDLPDIASGEKIATCALGTSVEVGEDGRLHGSIDIVLDAANADILVLQTADGQFHVVDMSAVEVVPLRVSDLTRCVSAVHLEAALSRPLATQDPEAVATALGDRINLLLASEQLGSMRKCIGISVEYAKMRHQFGRPIGSFQAVKHRLADMYATAQMATVLVREAQRAADQDPDTFGLAAAAARVFCDRAGQEVAQGTIQVHGGIGFTWEHVAHLYFKRARSTPQLFGGSVATETLLSARLGLT